MALRAVGGVEQRGESLGLEVIREGIAAEQFLNLDHTRRWFRKELDFPGRCIDRQVGEAWLAAGAKTSAQRAHEEVERLLAKDGSPLDPQLLAELDRLLEVE